MIDRFTEVVRGTVVGPLTTPAAIFVNGRKQDSSSFETFEEALEWAKEWCADKKRVLGQQHYNELGFHNAELRWYV